MTMISYSVARKVATYAQQSRDAADAKPSEKRMTPDGRKLYWVPLTGVDEMTGEAVQLIIFCVRPVSVRALDLVELVGVHHMRDFSTSSGVTSMMWCEDVKPIVNMLDAIKGGGHADDSADMLELPEDGGETR